MREVSGQGPWRNCDRTRPHWFSGRPVADRQFVVTGVAESITVQISLVRVKHACTVIHRTRSNQLPEKVVSILWVAESVTVGIGTWIACIWVSIQISIDLTVPITELGKGSTIEAT